MAARIEGAAKEDATLPAVFDYARMGSDQLIG
jgi:hypothetical protein